MFNIVLFEPEIPPNTGNIMRLCSNADLRLVLIKPLGFDLDDKHVRRAGLDYRSLTNYQLYDSFTDFLATVDTTRVFLCSTKANTIYSDLQFTKGDSFVFGPESRGLPISILDSFPALQKIVIPMQKRSRSINLANAVAIISYEALRQHNFTHLKSPA